MHDIHLRLRHVFVPMLLATITMIAMSSAHAQDRYRVRYLASSDGATPNTIVNPELVDAWGLAFDPYGFAYVAAPGSRRVVRLDGAGNAQPPSISTLGPGLQETVPVGITFNGSGNFQTHSSGGATGPSRMLITAEDGGLHGWNPDVDPAHAMRVYRSTAFPTLTGVALSGCCGRQLLYAAPPNWRTIVIETNYRRNPMPEGAFYDPEIAQDFYGPYNVQAIAGNLYVAYAQRTATRRVAPGFGSVVVFSPTGVLIRRIATTGALNSPWGMAMAPADFGAYSNKLLVGNTGDGRINVYDPTTSQFLGPLLDANGQPIVIDGLHALAFGNGVANQPVNALYFTAGPGNGERGLYGRIDVIH
jgi:uncharacterized protein (TIGR03118 family)